MSLTVTGLGMVSPAGIGPADHTFFVRAGVVTPPSSPFFTGDGERVDAWFCPWIGARLPIAERLAYLGETAARAALAGWPADSPQPIAAIVCMSRPRPGLSLEDREHTKQAIARAARVDTVEIDDEDDGGCFAALVRARKILDSNKAHRVLLVGVDSFASEAALTEHVRRPPSYWSDDVPPPSEGAAALVLTRSADARGAHPWGAVLGWATERGTSTDDDDEPADGVAMTTVLRRLPSATRVALVIGQAHVDELRRRDWHIASARTAARFAETHFVETLEREVGRVGAASGVLSLAYGLALARHEAHAHEGTRAAPFIAWSLSRDGTRGAALAQPAPSPSVSALPRIVAGHARPRLHDVARAPFEPGGQTSPASAADEEPLRSDPSVGLPHFMSELDAEMPAIAAPRGPAEGPVVHLAEEEIAEDRVDVRRFYADIVDRCADTIAMLARHRSSRRSDERADEEARLCELLDAIAATGARCVDDLLDWYRAALEAPDPWKVWAPVFVLGCLTGADVPDAIAWVLEALPEHDRESARIAADALVVVTHPERARIARMLCGSAHSTARAVGVDVAGRLLCLPTDAIVRFLSDTSPVVVAAAVRAALHKAPEEHALIAHLVRTLRTSDRDVAWESCRALALLGRAEPFAALKSDPSLAATLGPRVLDLLVLFGNADDLSIVEATLREGPVTASHLQAIARFGHPRSWAFLAHFLADPDMAPDAADALELLFGERLARADRLKPAAWREAIAKARLSPEVRIRRGEPWKPSSVVREIDKARVDRFSLEHMLDEAVVRALVPLRADLSLWMPDVQPDLVAVSRELERADRRFPAGTWACLTLQTSHTRAG